ncbi:MAG: site-specific integrase [Clostridiaceae bacterium]|nr:site-specific integrase [Clostridiaceae bacterium]
MNDLKLKGAYHDIKYISKPGLSEIIRISKLDAHSIGIHANTLRNAKVGSMISSVTAQKIADALHMSLRDLFTPHGLEKTLSAQTITHHLRCVSTVLSTAVEWQVIVSNPCDRVKAPRQNKKKINYLEIDEVQGLLDEAMKLEDIRVQTAVLIFLFTGIRKGELAGLEWSDIDFEKQIMSIERNMQYIRGLGLVTNSTKTDSGFRMISISASLIEQLKRYNTWQKEERLRAGSQWVDRNRLFTRWNGDYIAPSTVYHWVKSFLIQQGHDDITVHGLRHTNISVLLSQGVDLITASRRAGHSRPSTTANIYAHALRKPDEMAADMLEGLLGKKRSVEAI